MLNYSNKSVSEQHRKTLKMSDGSGSEGETYEVEKILDKKIVKGKTQYFIKWKGELQRFSFIYINTYELGSTKRKNMNR